VFYRLIDDKAALRGLKIKDKLSFLTVKDKYYDMLGQKFKITKSFS